MKRLLVALATAFSLLIASGTASAGGYANPANVPTHDSKPFHRFFFKQPLPAFQAAPWYLYWPYNSHFMTAAPPLDGDFGPGAPGVPGGYSNPYFPSQYGPRAK